MHQVEIDKCKFFFFSPHSFFLGRQRMGICTKVHPTHSNWGYIKGIRQKEREEKASLARSQLQNKTKQNALKFSFPKDFRDGVLMAEVLKHFFPRLISLDDVSFLKNFDLFISPLIIIYTFLLCISIDSALNHKKIGRNSLRKS